MSAIRSYNVSLLQQFGFEAVYVLLEAAGRPVPREMTGRSFLKLLMGAPHDGRTHVFAERGSHGSALPGNSAGFDLARVVITKSHKLIYNALGLQPYMPVDFGGDRFWKELVEMNAAGKLDPKFTELYFKPTRPLFELYDLASDPSEFNNLAGKAEIADIEKELKAALNEWMILENDYLPLPINPEPQNQNGSKNGGGGNKGGKQPAKPE